MAIIPGYDAVLELGSGTPDDVSAVGKAVNFSKRFNVLNRNTFGNAYATNAGGVYEVSFTFEGLVDSTVYATIEGHADGASTAFSLELGDAAGTTAGTWSGNCIIEEITAEATVDGDWQFRISARSTGAVTHA